MNVYKKFFFVKTPKYTNEIILLKRKAIGDLYNLGKLHKVEKIERQKAYNGRIELLQSNNMNIDYNLYLISVNVLANSRSSACKIATNYIKDVFIKFVDNSNKYTDIYFTNSDRIY